jgi:dCMP deaminase
MVEDNRISSDEYFMEMAKLAAKRSTCLRRQVGAVIVQDKHVVATGYNGAPKGIPHCAEMGGCYREKNNVPSGEHHELCRALHA